MKKLLFTVALISGIGFTSQASVITERPVVVSSVANATEYVEVKLSEVPQAVTDAVAKKHEGATIKKSALDKETMVYQITVTATDGKEVVSLFKENGEEFLEPAATTQTEPTPVQ